VLVARTVAVTYYAFLIQRPNEHTPVPLIIASRDLAEGHPLRVSEICVVRFEEVDCRPSS